MTTDPRNMTHLVTFPDNVDPEAYFSRVLNEGEMLIADCGFSWVPAETFDPEAEVCTCGPCPVCEAIAVLREQKEPS